MALYSTHTTSDKVKEWAYLAAYKECRQAVPLPALCVGGTGSQSVPIPRSWPPSRGRNPVVCCMYAHLFSLCVFLARVVSFLARTFFFIILWGKRKRSSPVLPFLRAVTASRRRNGRNGEGGLSEWGCVPRCLRTRRSPLPPLPPRRTRALRPARRRSWT